MEGSRWNWGNYPLATPGCHLCERTGRYGREKKVNVGREKGVGRKAEGESGRKVGKTKKRA